MKESYSKLEIKIDNSEVIKQVRKALKDFFEFDLDILEFPANYKTSENSVNANLVLSIIKEMFPESSTDCQDVNGWENDIYEHLYIGDKHFRLFYGTYYGNFTITKWEVERW